MLCSMRLVKPARLRKPVVALQSTQSTSVSSRHSTDQLGLLIGTGDIKKAKHYTKDLPEDTYKQLVDEKHLFFNHIMRDTNNNWRAIEPYLRKAHTAARDFLYSGEVADRQQLRFTLSSLAELRGQYILLLGSKSIGKSCVLKDLEKRHCERVFRIDMRQNKDLIAGIMGALKMQYRYQEKSVRSLVTTIVQAATVLVKELARLKNMKFTTTVTDEKNTLIFVLLQMVRQFGHITIIIDEATMAFKKPFLQDDKDVALAKTNLEIFASLTKQDQQARVLERMVYMVYGVWCIASIWCVMFGVWYM
ncbi:hypothetical protein EON63_01620 [archaeon]|nr:MAG: hypothetical protein EON63_01620 [archaeon]